MIHMGFKKKKISWWRQLLCQTERGEGQGRIQCISQWQLLALLPSRWVFKWMLVCLLLENNINYILGPHLKA
uniref:Uncharacterized protein n=1 Tax=Salix viminalis TaxID=40686 RepID=A0A6N2MAG5_SALVM